MTKIEFCKKWLRNLEKIKYDRDYFIKYLENCKDSRALTTLLELKQELGNRLASCLDDHEEDGQYVSSGKKFFCDSDLRQTFEASINKRLAHAGRIYRIGDVFVDTIETGPGPTGSVKIKIVGFELSTNKVIVQYLDKKEKLYAIQYLYTIADDYKKI
ncbi:hypothetical protein HON36_03805 [Candidatus Parcubacteria bacterium]|jgi:hypothetical protein|nr:hypothetical protein [Candidatus Parcubacteria bacterium]MBT7228048.1 hypothetical protein [Candidatus Parcubacteria bacterium]